MKAKSVKDVMLPLSEYAVVSMTDTVKDALYALDRAQLKVPPGRQPHRAVLVADSEGKIIGKLGHLGFLRAFEPKYDTTGDIDKLSRAGVADGIVDSMREHFRFWQNDFMLLCRRARTKKIEEVMHPVEESIDENASLTEAVHRMIMWQTLSILVTRSGEVVGILRLSDLFSVIADAIKSEDG